MTSTASTRSRMFQLLALGFAHPVAEFYQLLTDGSYARALTSSSAGAVGCHCYLPPQQGTFAEFEADYIHLFQMGRGGKPIIALTAGDHKELNNEQGRPEFLLQYTAWYKHFGLKMNEDEGANELPDHLVCQLELMAWLSHLEDSAAQEPALQQGYQSAQRDFLQRHLQVFLELLVTELQRAAERPHGSPFHLALAALALELTDGLQQSLDELADSSSQTYVPGDSNQIAAVNLWG